MRVVTFDELESHLEEIINVSADQHEVVVIKRPCGKNVILLSESDYKSLKETSYLLSNEINAQRLRKSIRSLSIGKVVKKS